MWHVKVFLSNKYAREENPINCILKTKLSLILTVDFCVIVQLLIRNWDNGKAWMRILGREYFGAEFATVSSVNLYLLGILYSESLTCP
jgi:hypothetical protein